MERDYGREIDELREEIRSLKKEEQPQVEEPKNKLNAVMRFYCKSEKDVRTLEKELASSGKQVPEWGKKLAQIAIDKHYKNGFAKFAGIFRSPEDEGHMWILEHSIDELLKLDEATVEKVLSAIGNRSRLKILKTILESPSNVNELISKLEMKTTGKAYHHLNLLENTDLIYKDESGRYHFRGHRVSGFLSALFCVQNTVDDKYTSGNMDKLPLSMET